MSDFASRFYAATGIVLGTKDASKVRAFCEGAKSADDRPETYTPEELALWDQLAVVGGHAAVDSYRATHGRWLDMLKARREAIIRDAMMEQLRKEAGEATKEREKSNREIDALRALFAPAQPEPKREEMPCPNCKEPIKVSTEHILFMHEIPYPRYTCQPAPSPAPVAGELAEAVRLVRWYHDECMKQGIMLGPINGDAEAFLADEPAERGEGGAS